MKKGYTLYPRTFLTMGLIMCSLFIFNKCIDRKEDEKEIPQSKEGNLFAGSSACAGCHKKITEQHSSTRHFLTSAISQPGSIKGSFELGKNIFAYNPSSWVAMEKKDTDFFQVEYLNGIETKRHRFDISIGSGTKGQTYLYWENDQLYQLPVTYFTPVNQWTNSPDFPGKAVFGRSVTSRCLECHSTSVQKISDPEVEPESYDSDQIVYGVDCEKCHGPAAEHVVFQTEHPRDTIAKFIINPAILSVQQNLDLCALCHGGRLTKTKPSFSFQAGLRLSDYFAIDTTSRPVADIDVHGNQLGLLAASKCFKMSNTMTCNTCHQPHENERNNLAVFSQRCMNCHQTGQAHTCRVKNKPTSVIQKNCIDCHMPEQPSRAIAVLLQGSTTPMRALMRTHYIKIYSENTDIMRGEIKKIQAFK